MAQTIVAPTVPIDHAALDVILSHLERRYGLDPRIDRAYRIVVSDRVDLSVVDSKAGLVHGDSGHSYWATVDGFCECPDAQRVARCKHALAVTIAVQLRAVAKAKAAEQAALRETFAALAREHQHHGHELIASGVRPIDDAAYRAHDEQLQAMREQLPAATLIRQGRHGRGVGAARLSWLPALCERTPTAFESQTRPRLPLHISSLSMTDRGTDKA